MRSRRRKKILGKAAKVGQILVATGLLIILILAASRTLRLPATSQSTDLLRSKLTPDMIALATASAGILLPVAIFFFLARRSKRSAILSSLADSSTSMTEADADNTRTTEKQTKASAPAGTTDVITPIANQAEQSSILRSIERLEELAASMAQKATTAAVDLPAPSELRELLISQINNVISGDLIRTIRERYGIDHMESSFADSKSRISGVIQSLRLRNMTVVMTGFSFAFCGIGSLFFFVIKNQPDQISGAQLVSCAPHIAIVFILEVLAYFCMNLYQRGLGDLRYYQNEMTNIESREAALHAALISGNESQIAQFVSSLFATDRNALHVMNNAQVYRRNGNPDQLVAMEAISQIADLARKMS